MTWGVVKMENVFQYALDFVLQAEGGYCVDTGGETNMGISKRAYPNEDIKGMTRSRAAEIYRADYWDRAKCSKFPAPIAMILFDSAVNLGIRQASIALQWAISDTLTENHIGVDGMIGPETIAAALALDKCGKTQNLADAFIKQRQDHYTELATGKTFKPYLQGWLNRLENLKKAIKNIPTN